MYLNMLQKKFLLVDPDNDIPKAIEKGILQYILSKQPKDILFDTDLSPLENKFWKSREFKIK